MSWYGKYSVISRYCAKKVGFAFVIEKTSYKHGRASDAYKAVAEMVSVANREKMQIHQLIEQPNKVFENIEMHDNCGGISLRRQREQITSLREKNR